MSEVSYYNNYRSEMNPFLPGSYETVLEIGCGEGLYRQNCLPAAEYWGVEPHKESASKAMEKIANVLNGTFEEVATKIPDSYFDLVICNDVIEHMIDPDVFLEKKGKMKPGAMLVGSVPNVRFLPNLLELLVQKDWAYMDSGILDRTHLRFYTQKSLKRSLRNAGYSVELMCGINPLASKWKSVRKIYRSIKMLVQLRLLGADARYMQFGFRARVSAHA